MSEVLNCATACPIQEWCAEGEARRELISTDVIVDASIDVVTALRRKGAEVKQYDDELFEDLSAAQRELIAQDVDRSSPQFFNQVSQVMERHHIPAQEWGSVMIGKVAWTAVKAVEEATKEIAKIDEKLSEFDLPTMQLWCPGEPEIIVSGQPKVRMCASSVIKLSRRQEMTR